MGIQFDNIPANIRVPGVYGEINASLAGNSPVEHVVLIVGTQKGGSATAETPYVVTDPVKAEALFGQGSQLSLMIHAARVQSRNVEIVAIPLDEEAGGQAADDALLTFSGAATSSGVIHLYIGAFFGNTRIFGHVRVPVVTGDTAADVAATAETLINEDLQLPVTGAAVLGVVTLTCKWNGAAGNDIEVVRDFAVGDAAQSPVGLDLVITPFTSGLLDPDIGDALAAAGAVHYHTLITGYSDGTTLDTIALWAEDRWGPTVQKEVVAFSATSGSLATMLAFGDTRNDRTICVMGSHVSISPTWIWAASFGIEDARLVSNGDVSRPRQRLALKPVFGVAPADGLTFDELNLLLKGGISAFSQTSSGAVNLLRAITTYQETPDAIADTAYLDLTTMRTLAAIRQNVRAFFTLKYPRTLLADDGGIQVAGLIVMTPALARAEMNTLYTDTWVPAGWVEAGAADQYAADLVVERNALDVNRLDIRHSPDLMNGLIVLAHQIQFIA